MELRQLGRTDIRVSAIGLGTMTFGSKTPEADAFRQLDMAVDAGINLFDTAENYPSPVIAGTQGRSEEILGRWIASRGIRSRVIVATKVTGPENAVGSMTHIRGANRRLDRANIFAAIDGSLRRLGTEYIDLYQLHWPDRTVTTTGRARFSNLPDPPGVVPIEETLAALGELVAGGKVRHVGVCNETPWGVMRYLQLSQERGSPRVVTVQNGYSLLSRQFEMGLAEIALREQVGLIAFSPLARGLLTENAAQAVNTDPRFSAKRLAATTAYIDLAKRHGLSVSTMALAFARQQPFTLSVLTAASNAGQLANNLQSIDVTLSKELLKEINSLHDESPNPR